jgi:hypothetical protein
LIFSYRSLIYKILSIYRYLFSLCLRVYVLPPNHLDLDPCFINKKK